MNIKPIGNRLVVKLIKKPTTTASGIIVSTEDENQQARGEIVAIGGGQGDDENITELGLSAGQVVVFGQYSGEEIEDDSDSTVYKVLQGKDVIAVIE